MGLSLSSLRFIVRQHLRRPLGDHVCTLGRQRVVATYDQVVAMMLEEGWTPWPLASDTDLSTNIPSWKGRPESKYTSDVVFFRLLGVESVTAIDISAYEKADETWDLNKPIPDRLAGRFDTVVDGGTIEHVHDVHEAIRNVNRLAKSTGICIHFTPTSNYIDHGYHQLSPIFFVDYYAANRFETCEAWLFEHIRPFGTMDRWNLYRHKHGVPVAPLSWLRSNRSWGTIVVARKSAQSTVDAVPIQGSVSLPWEPVVRDAAANGSLMSRLRARLEPTLRQHAFLWKTAVRSVVVAHQLVYRRPTRHHYVGKL